MKNIKYFIATIPTSALLAPMFAFAQGATPTGGNAVQGLGNIPGTPTELQSLGAFRNFICTVVFGWVFTFLIVLAAIFGLVAAFKYLTAGGDPEKIKAASNVLIYAAVAVVAALFARGLPYLVATLFQGGALNNGVAC